MCHAEPQLGRVGNLRTQLCLVVQLVGPAQRETGLLIVRTVAHLRTELQSVCRLVMYRGAEVSSVYATKDNMFAHIILIQT